MKTTKEKIKDLFNVKLSNEEFVNLLKESDQGAEHFLHSYFACDWHEDTGEWIISNKLGEDIHGHPYQLFSEYNKERIELNKIDDYEFSYVEDPFGETYIHVRSKDPKENIRRTFMVEVDNEECRIIDCGQYTHIELTFNKQGFSLI